MKEVSNCCNSEVWELQNDAICKDCGEHCEVILKDENANL